MKEQGIFAFTIEEKKPDQDDEYVISRVDVSEKPKADTAVTLFRHRNDYIAKLLGNNGFVLHKELEFLAFKYSYENKDIFWKAYIAQKRGQI